MEQKIFVFVVLLQECNKYYVITYGKNAEYLNKLHFKGKGKKNDDWSDNGSDVELKELSDEEVVKPVTKKKCELFNL